MKIYLVASRYTGNYWWQDDLCGVWDTREAAQKQYDALMVTPGWDKVYAIQEVEVNSVLEGGLELPDPE